jgi:hypothetical protein
MALKTAYSKAGQREINASTDILHRRKLILVRIWVM